jgi:hypothetical protein
VGFRRVRSVGTRVAKSEVIQEIPQGEKMATVSPVFERVFAVLQAPDAKTEGWALADEWAHRLHAPLQEVSPDAALRNGSWRQQLGISDLFICGADVPAKFKKGLLRETQRRGGPALLLSSALGALPTRILLIDQDGTSSNDLLLVTMRLCEIFRAELVALTVARAEQEARQRQRQAREIIEGRSRDGAVRVNFDFLAGGETRSAAANVARWRRCQLVVMEAGPSTAWSRWLGSAPGPWVLDLLHDLSFLLLPSAKARREEATKEEAASRIEN